LGISPHKVGPLDKGPQNDAVVILTTQWAVQCPSSLDSGHDVSKHNGHFLWGVGMVLAQMVVDSVVLEGRSIRATAQRYGVSKSWVHELVRRFRVGDLFPAIIRGHSFQLSNPILTRCNVAIFTTPVGARGLEPRISC